MREIIAKFGPEADGPCAPNRFLDLLKTVVSVPKSEIDRREAEYQRECATKKTRRTKAA
jgi:hypothetical protein